MMLSPHFSVAEFCDSDTARRLGINNDMPLELRGAAQQTAQMLEAVRLHLGSLAGKTVPIIITSGYRCPALNRAIGSGDKSDHVRASAVDIKAPAFGSAFEVSKALAQAFEVLRLGQLIYEHTWTHISIIPPDRHLNKVLTVQGRGYVVGIQGAAHGLA